MKRIVFFAAIMAFMVNTNAQWFDISNNKGRADLGVSFGMAGIGCDYHSFAFGGGLIIQPIRQASIYAVYTRHAIYGGISISLDECAKNAQGAE